MLRDSSATESIYGFASEQADVQPSEPIFVLTSSQLRDVITEATKPLNLKVEAMEGRGFIQLEGDKAKFEGLEKDMDSLADNLLIQLRLINDLRKDKEPQPLQKDRGEILRALIVANGGKMLSKEARLKMHMDRASFSRLLSTIKDDVEVKSYHLNKSWKVLVLK